MEGIREDVPMEGQLPKGGDLEPLSNAEVHAKQTATLAGIGHTLRKHLHHDQMIIITSNQQQWEAEEGYNCLFLHCKGRFLMQATLDLIREVLESANPLGKVVFAARIAQLLQQIKEED